MFTTLGTCNNHIALLNLQTEIDNDEAERLREQLCAQEELLAQTR